MNKLMLTIIILFLPFFVSAHGGVDPLKELNKNKSRLSSVQNEFEQLITQDERFENLEKQASYLQKNISILRHLMAKDYPHVTSDMSKYTLDYIEEVDNGLKEFKQTLRQMKTVIEK